MGIFDFFKKKTGEVQIPDELENTAEEKRDADGSGEATAKREMAENEKAAKLPSEMATAEDVAAGQTSAGLSHEPGAFAGAAEPSQAQAAAAAGEEMADRSGAQTGDQANWAEVAAGEKLVNSADRQSDETDAAAGSEEAAAKREVEECVAAEVAQEEAVSESEPVEEVPQKKGFFRKLVEGLSKTRQHVMQGVNDVLSSFTSIDEDFYEDLEEALIMGDLGVNTAIKIVAGLKAKVKERKIKDPQQVKSLLKEELKEQMRTAESAYDFINRKSVILVIGVNGVGKTTTIGKLAAQYKKDGKQVMLAAADTFRAAAIDQLKEWARRSDVPIVAQAENSDPGAVIFDAIASAKSKGIDILICDTAGRLHNKKNLMAELGKIYRIIGREYPEAHLEVFLVLDSTTGQNALAQAKEFKEMADITGIVLTKLDGTSKGGIAVAIAADLALPVKYIGVGEGIEDLRPFDADSFIEALFEE